VVSSGLDISLAEAPIFKGAKFSGARIIARLSRFDLSGADFTGARMRPIIAHYRAATCWQPRMKGLTTMANSIFIGWRMEDVWLDR